MQPEPCSQFRPGRSTGHDICESCGWSRHEHPKHHTPAVTSAPGTMGDALNSELASALLDRDRYHTMLLEIGAMFGKAAMTADNGDLQRGVIVTKVPGLVRDLLNVKGYRAASDKLPLPDLSKLPEPALLQAAIFTEQAKANPPSAVPTAPTAPFPDPVYDKPKAGKPVPKPAAKPAKEK